MRFLNPDKGPVVIVVISSKDKAYSPRVRHRFVISCSGKQRKERTNNSGENIKA